jgi:hypothetical protein
MAADRRDRVGCADFHRSLAAERVSRRGLLKAGALGAAGMTLSNLLRLEARAATAGKGTGRKPSVIILWMRGGPPQHETWDPKPDAPAEYRGEFGHISTKVPGIILNEFLPLSARIMDKWSIIRSLHHTDAGHSTGDQICFTGYPADPRTPEDNAHPSCGSIVARQLQHLDPSLPAYVMVPRERAGNRLCLPGPQVPRVRDDRRPGGQRSVLRPEHRPGRGDHRRPAG